MRTGGEASRRRRQTAIALLIVSIGTAIFIPTIKRGFESDDFLHLGVLESNPRFPHGGVLDLYRLLDRSIEFNDVVQGESIPWWISDHISARYFRPLSSLVHYLDYLLYRKTVVGYRVTTLALWGILLFLVVRLFAALAIVEGEGGLVVVCAGLLLAVDDTNVTTISWLACRYALISAVFVVAGILGYHQYRQRNSSADLVAAVAFFVLALLSGETGMSFLGWIVAYELFLGPGSVLERIRKLTVFGLIAVAYSVGYVVFGFGIDNLWSFVGPERLVLENFPRLMMGLLTPISAEFQSPEWSENEITRLAWGLTVACLVLLLPIFLRKRTIRFMALGALVSLIPVLVLPHNRMLLLSSIGTAWVLGFFVVDAVVRLRLFVVARDHSPIKSASSIGALAVSFVVAVAIVLRHIVYALWVTPSMLTLEPFKSVAEAALHAPMPSTERIHQARVLTIKGPAVYSTLIPHVRAGHDLPWPGGFWTLSGRGGGSYRFSTTGPNSFRLEATEGFLGTPFRHRLPPRVGRVFDRGEVRIEIAGVTPTNVSTIVVTTDFLIGSEDTWILSLEDGRWRRINPPEIGESITF